MGFSYSALIASISVACFVVITLYFRKVLQLDPEGLMIVTHYRRGDLGVNTFSHIFLISYWFFALLVVAAVVLMSFLLSWCALL